MPRPTEEPIGRALARASKTVGRAFDDALRDAGGSQPIWLVLIAVKSRGPRTQRELAEAVGIRGATLTHHLDAMEADGLVTREREPDNRRVQRVRLTPAGDAMFDTLRGAAGAFDQRIRRGLTGAELAAARAVLDKLASNAVVTKEVIRD